MSASKLPEVVHQPARQRFEITVQGGLGYLSYTRQGQRITINHTFVPIACRGQGIAAALVRAALAEARRQGWRVIAQCSYVADFVRRHSEYADVMHIVPEAD